MKKSEKGFGIVEILLVLLVISLLVIVGWLVYDRQRSKNGDSQEASQLSQSPQSDQTLNTDSPRSLEKGTYDGTYGTFQAKGYITIRSEKDPENICGNTCATHENTYFNITEAANEQAAKLKGSPFLVGCFENSILMYKGPSADGTGIKSYSFTESDSVKIKNATSQDPIMVDFNNIKFTGSSAEVPACYTTYTFNVSKL